MFDSTNLAKAIEELENYYLSSGKYGVKIESSVKEISKNKIHLQVSIYAGDDARIKQIKIVGNHFFKEKTLLKELHIGKTNWLSWYTKRDRYAKEKLAADLEVLRAFYMDRGFVNFQINSKICL